MRLKRLASCVLLAALPYLDGTIAAGQVGETEWEGRPKAVSAIDLLPRTRLDTWVESQQGLDFSFQRWRTGGLLSRRMKPILNMHLRDIDENNDHYLVLDGGYEYLHTIDRGSRYIENDIIVDATPHILLAGLLLSNRNRIEFRWINGVYDYRYRNRLTIFHESQAGSFRFTPYAYGELFYHSKSHSWSSDESAAGVRFPYKSRFMLDTYWLHESCSHCNHSSVSMIGVTLNFYFRQLQ
jgi:hypothetical protein